MNFKNLYAITDRESIMDPQDCGLVNGQLSINGWLTEVNEIRQLFAPPFFSENFRMCVRVNDKRVMTRSYRWSPEKLTRTGNTDGFKVVSDLIPLKNARAAIMRTSVKNMTSKQKDVTFQYEVYAGVNKKEHWFFGHPVEPCFATKTWDGKTLFLNNDRGEIQVGSTLELSPNMPVCTGVLNGKKNTLKPGKSLTFYSIIAIGRHEDNEKILKAAYANPEKCCKEAQENWFNRVKNLFAKVPELQSDNKDLVKYYNKSLIHLLLNEWNVPDFFMNPHYGTGSICGDTICCYMWNYGGPYRMWSLLSPESAKAHFRHLLSLDLSNCYAFYADDGVGFGPYYPINQEKVIFLAYYYVMQTGDTAVLTEDLLGKPLIEHLLDQAYLKDDLSKEAHLVNYGPRGDHLELRGPTHDTDPMMRYNGVMPDLNLRRCVNYRLVDELCKMINYKPQIDLVKRANALKELIHKELFDRKEGWFKCLSAEDCVIYRYTNQMFKALGWEDWCMKPEAEKALVKHLVDETQFLGRFGVHSLSKQDPAYYEDDVDNGGPGACVSFTPAIIDRLYRSGWVKEAEKILSRLLWMAGCLPYYGDSQRGDVRDYRRRTSLQCDIEGAVPAQTIIFGMFGIKIKPDFSVEINPHLFPDTERMKLKNIRLAGKVFDIECDKVAVKVKYQGKVITAKPGKTIVLK